MILFYLFQVFDKKTFLFRHVLVLMIQTSEFLCQQFMCLSFLVNAFQYFPWTSNLNDKPPTLAGPLHLLMFYVGQSTSYVLSLLYKWLSHRWYFPHLPSLLLSGHREALTKATYQPYMSLSESPS